MPTCRKISYRNNISTIMWGHNVVDLDPFRFATITWIQIRSDSQQCCGSGSVQIHNNYSDRDPIRFATITRIRSCTTNCHESVKENLTKLVHKDLLIIKSVLKLKFFYEKIFNFCICLGLICNTEKQLKILEVYFSNN